MSQPLLNVHFVKMNVRLFFASVRYFRFSPKPSRDTEREGNEQEMVLRCVITITS